MQRSRLVIPIDVAEGSQYVSSTGASNNFALTIPEAVDSDDVFELTGVALRPVRKRRVAGGVSVPLDVSDTETSFLVTSNPKLSKNLARKVNARAVDFVGIKRELARNYLASVIETEKQIRAVGPNLPQGNTILRQADSALQATKRAHSQKDFSGANDLADRSLAALRHLIRLRWRQATAGISPAASPFRLHYSTLPMYWQFANQIQRLSSRSRALSRSGFENLEELTNSGWKHFESDTSALHANVELTPHRPWQGSYSLHLAAKVPSGSPGASVTTPVWINSPSVSVQAGEILRIRAWVRTNQPIQSLDGLMVFDSLLGPGNAYRMKEAQEWDEIVLYRQADRARKVFVTFALTGTGEVDIDDFLVESLGVASMMSFQAASRETRELSR